MKKLLAALIIITMLFITSCRPKEKTVSDQYFALDTVISIKLFGTDDENILQGCFSICDEYENMLSKTLPQSYIYQINNANGEPVKVPDEVIEILNKALYYCELTNGAFDITIAPVMELWDFKSENPTPPNNDSVNNALEHVNYKNITIENNYVSLSDPLAQIDLGAIAKGFIADKIAEYLTKNNVSSALINLGGNVYAHGRKQNKQDWSIGIQSPFSKLNEIALIVNIESGTCVTSGTYERSFTYNGKLYHHLIDTKTGYPADNGLASVTIITKNSADADALSTSCFLLGLEKGLALIKSTEDTEAVFIKTDGTLIKTDNVKSS